MIFVHGFNVSGQAARGWHAEMFKRLYWSLSKARFVGVSWFGNPDDAIGGFPADYHLSVRNAFATAPVFAQAINALPGRADAKVVVAHSLACLMVASALTDDSDATKHLTVGKTCFVDAALPMEALDGRDPGNYTTENSNMTPAAWRDYDKTFYAANWFSLFAADDTRSQLTWGGRYASAAGKIYNFYSSTENVLAEFPYEVPSSVFTTPLKTIADGSFTWVIQEKAKGAREDYLLGLTHAGSYYMGWGFNLKDPVLEIDPLYWKWYLDPEDPNNDRRIVKTAVEIGSITYAVLRRHPVFDPGWGQSLRQAVPERPVSNTSSEPGAPNDIFTLYGTTVAQSFAVANRAQLLAEGIPSLTWALGSHKSTSSIPTEQNIDLPSLADPVNWPRGQKTGTVLSDWRHSDMREVAYLYQFMFFNRLKSLSSP